MQVWGQEEAKAGQTKKVDFKPDVKRAIGTPFVLPTGGMPLSPQGSYGIPVYPCYDRHLGTEENLEEGKKSYSFRKSTEHVYQFLYGRLKRTHNVNPDALPLMQIAHLIHAQVSSMPVEKGSKFLGIIILA